jgi:hypothetical protein
MTTLASESFRMCWNSVWRYTGFRGTWTAPRAEGAKKEYTSSKLLGRMIAT